MKFSLALLSLLLLSAAPPPQTYCAPVALKDYNLVVRYTARVKVTTGCQKPALIRKVTPAGALLGTYRVEVGEVRQIPVFIARLEYTLNGWSWLKLRVR